MHVSVAILRVPEGLDYTGIIADFDSCADLNSRTKNIKSEGLDNPSFVPEENIIATHEIGTWLNQSNI